MGPVRVFRVALENFINDEVSRQQGGVPIEDVDEQIANGSQLGTDTGLDLVRQRENLVHVNVNLKIP